ncbi:MAG TPA: ATP-binding protein [Gemmatimonadaceae bacterium]|jgi:signal transduction histidine kinase
MPQLLSDRGIDAASVASRVFPGPSIMAARCRAFDWSTTPLGPIEQWPLSLRTLVAQILESRHPMFLWWGPDLVQIFNDAYLPSFGTTGRDVTALGAKGQEHWAEIWPIIGPQIQGVMTAGEATWHVDQCVPIERNGTLEDVWWTYGYSPVRNDDADINGVLVVVQETTQRVLLEHRLRDNSARLVELFRHAPAFICVLRGPKHVFELTNGAYQQLIGFRDVIGVSVGEALPEAKDQGFVDLLDRVLATGEPFVGREIPILLQHSPGEPMEERSLDFVYQAIIESDGSRSGVFVHGVDVTDLVRSRATAEEANRAKSDFLAVMSHELRTPLNAIGGYAELMELGIHGPVTSPQRDALARIQNSQRHLLGLINQVLNYTRIENGNVSYNLDRVPVSGELRAAEELVKPQMIGRGLTLVMSDCDPSIHMYADADKVRQILLNLLTNASKFTDEGGTITVWAEASADSVSINVRDTGVGIDASKLAAIFEPFVQVDIHLTRTHDGIGLGLAISRDLARGMHGDLVAESTVGVGSVFRLTLPASSPIA